MKFLDWIKWVMENYLKTEHFVNTMAAVIVGTLVYKELMDIPVTSDFKMLGSIIIGYYFRSGLALTGLVPNKTPDKPL